MPRVRGSADELRALVVEDQLPLVRLVQKEPLQMQAFHLSFQEYYAMRAIRDGGASLPDFAWGAWWTNAVLMGVQVGDAFGKEFVKAAGLAAGQDWRLRVAAALVAKGLPAAWLPTIIEAARGGEEKVAQLVKPLAAKDAPAVGQRVLAIDSVGNWQSALVTRAGDMIDVNFGGSKNEGLTMVSPS